MDIKVSRKEQRYQQRGTVEVLVDDVFDVYPIEDPYNENIITDIEILDDENTELLDRAMFATVKQRGGDPIEPESGVQWAEAVIGEVPPEVIMQQVQNEVYMEGPTIRIEYETVIDDNNEERLVYSLSIKEV